MGREPNRQSAAARQTGRHASQIRKEPEYQDHNAADYEKPGNRYKGDCDGLDRTKRFLRPNA